jgi:hypothetical protein
MGQRNSSNAEIRGFDNSYGQILNTENHSNFEFEELVRS